MSHVEMFHVFLHGQDHSQRSVSGAGPFLLQRLRQCVFLKGKVNRSLEWQAEVSSQKEMQYRSW